MQGYTSFTSSPRVTKLHGEDHRRSAAVAAHGGAGDAGGASRLEAKLLPGLAAGADVPRFEADAALL